MNLFCRDTKLFVLTESRPSALSSRVYSILECFPPTILYCTDRHARAPGSGRFWNANLPTNRRKVSSNLRDLCQTFFRARQTDFYNFWIWSQDVWTIQRIRIWSSLDDFWSHFDTMAACTNPVAQETNLTDLCRTFFRTHQTDFYKFWIWPQDVWTIQRIRIWTRLGEFWLL